MGARQQKKYVLTFILLKLQIKDKIWDQARPRLRVAVDQQQSEGEGDFNFVDFREIFQGLSLGRVASYQPVTKVLLIIVNDFVNVPGHEIEIRVGME